MEQLLLLNDDSYYQQTYGMDKGSFENKLNIGIGQCISGMMKDWNTIKEELLAKIPTRKAQ